MVSQWEPFHFRREVFQATVGALTIGLEMAPLTNVIRILHGCLVLLLHKLLGRQAYRFEDASWPKSVQRRR